MFGSIGFVLLLIILGPLTVGQPSKPSKGQDADPDYGEHFTQPESSALTRGASH